jgi:hypothetical protein
MIKEIHYIYIMDGSGNPIFVRENYVQGSQKFNPALLSRFVTALQSFATEFGQDEMRVAELGDENIFTTKIDTGIQFMLVTGKKVKHKKMFKLLDQIKTLFMEKFAKYSIADGDEKREIMGSFVFELNNTLEPIDKLTKIFKA